MSMKKLIALATVVLSFSALSETYCFLKFAEGSNDWADPKNYYTDWSFSSPKGALPADGDRILLQGQGAEKFEANFDGSQINILRKAGTMIIVQ